MRLVGQLPDPARGHTGDGAAERAAGWSGHGGPGPQVGEAALQRGDRLRHPGHVDGHELAEAGVAGLRAGDIAAAAEDDRVVVVAVGAPGEPAGGEVELLRRGVRVDSGRAQRQVERAQLALVPHALAEDARRRGPGRDVLARGAEMRAEGQRERHLNRGAFRVADRLERDVGEAAQPLRRGHGQRGDDAGGLRAQPGRAAPARPGAGGGIPGGPRVPLMAAGLPVLEPLRVPPHGQPRGRIQAVLVAHDGNLGERRVLELLQTGCEQVVHPVRGLLDVTAEEPLQHQHAVGQLPLLVHLTLVGEQVIAQVHGVGERVAQHPHRTRAGDCDRHLGVAGVLDQVGRPRRPADLAPHLDVLDRVNHPAGVDVGQLPQRFVQQVAGAPGKAGPPPARAGRHGALPQVGQPRLHRVGGSRRDLPGRRHERGQCRKVGACPVHVVAALEQLEKMVVEVEHPHVPVGDQVKQFPGGVGMGVSAQQGVVMGVEVPLGPDHRAVLRRVDHVHRLGPGFAVGPGPGQVRVTPRRVRGVELGQRERRRHDSAA